MQIYPKSVLALTILAGLGLTPCRPVAAQTTTVYSNDFSAGAGSEWSPSTTDTTPGTLAHPADAFLGQFGNQTTTLSLTGLATHSQVTVTFDLYMIRTMDGNGPEGPDSWTLTENGSTLIATNFATATGLGQTQDFGGPDGSGGYLTGGHYAPFTGATEVATLGFLNGSFVEDAVFPLSFTFADASSSLNFNFIGGQNQGIDDESWGLDNVVVKTISSPVPEASTTASFGLLLALGLGGLIVTARRKKAGLVS